MGLQTIPEELPTESAKLDGESALARFLGILQRLLVPVLSVVLVLTAKSGLMVFEQRAQLNGWRGGQVEPQRAFPS